MSLRATVTHAQSAKLDFEKDAVGKAPGGFSFALTGRGKPGVWSGKGDQGAGLVWRYRDQNNYYITRCNALEDNCTIYHVVNGRRVPFLNQKVKVASNVWHTLRVEAVDDHFVVTDDGKKVLDAKDGTFKEAGKVGLWTKADSVIAFDDVSIAGR
jgi:hypothetical protein